MIKIIYFIFYKIYKRFFSTYLTFGKIQKLSIRIIKNFVLSIKLF